MAFVNNIITYLKVGKAFDCLAFFCTLAFAFYSHFSGYLAQRKNGKFNIGKDKTVFLSTHIMQEVEAICDRIIIIHKGKIVEDAQLTDLGTNLEKVFREKTK
jgi:ABC-type oligopeptide transport system ATPase subunit